MRFRSLIALIIAALTLAPPAIAQARAGGELLLATRYLWRGVERTSGFVLQPDLYIAYGLPRGGWITGGVWGNIELEAPTASDLSDRTSGAGLGERNAWLEVSPTVRGVDCTLGWIGYFRRLSLTNTAAPTRYDTHEVYAAIQARSSYLSPRVSAWYDVSRVRGLYMESSIDVPIMGAFRGRQFWAIYLTATGGLNVGQSPDRRRPLDPVNFAHKGLTHLDLGAAVAIRGPWSDLATTQIETHLQFNRDPLTKRHSLSPGDDDYLATVWVGLSVGAPAYHARGE